MLNVQKPAEKDDALALLRELIDQGEYAPGDRLPPERELIFKLGVGRTALRKGLDALEREGTIWRHVGKGTFIAAQNNNVSGAVLTDLSQAVTPVHMMRARLSLEPALAREAAINASDDAVIRVQLARDRAASASTWDDYEAQDDAFHRAVAEATGNVLLLSLFDHLNQVRRAVAWNTVVRSSPCPPKEHSSYAEHNDIVEAIKLRDPQAAHAAMRKHLGSVSARLFGEV